MYLNTLGKHELYQSLTEIMNTTEECLKKYIVENKDDIIDCHYAAICQNYLISFEVSTDKIDFENFSEEIKNNYKTELLVKYAIMALAYFETGERPFFPMYNPIIYLKRDYDVPGDDICKVWKLRGENSKVVPEH